MTQEEFVSSEFLILMARAIAEIEPKKGDA
jgi:hypothetical protein